MNVQKLMDMDWAGSAEAEVRRLGYWDEANDIPEFDDHTLYEFHFTVSGFYEPVIQEEEVTITASSLEIAQLNVEHLVDFDEIEFVNLEKIVKLN